MTNKIQFIKYAEENDTGYFATTKTMLNEMDTSHICSLIPEYVNAEEIIVLVLPIGSYIENEYQADALLTFIANHTDNVKLNIILKHLSSTHIEHRIIQKLMEDLLTDVMIESIYQT